jgi:hypothetical protein
VSDRELLTECLEALTHDAAQRTFAGGVRMSQLAIKLRAALAAPRSEPVAWMYVNLEGECEQIEYGTEAIDDDSITLLYAAPPAAAPEPVRHPGYIIGNHWLETAYSRVCAGEAEADVLKDCGWERVTDADALRRDAELGRWIREETPPIEEIAARVDAMEDKP